MSDVKFLVTVDSKKGTAAIKLLDKNIEDLGKSAKKATPGIKGMWKQMAVGLGVTQLATSGIRMLRRQFADTIETGREFEREWANVTTMLTVSQEETDKLRKELRELSPTLGDTTDLAKGMYQVLSASIKPAKAIKFLGDAAESAMAGITDTRTAVDALTTVINAYRLEAEAATDVSDIMFGIVKRGKLTYEELAGSIGTVVPVASMLGIEFREIGGAISTLTRQGIQASKATMYLRQVLMAVLKATDETKQQAKDLGFEFTAEALAAKGLGEFLADLKEGTKGNAELLKVFIPDVRALSGVMALCGAAAQGFAEDLDFLKDVAGLTAEAFDKQKDSLDFWIKVAGASMDKFKEAFYEGFADPVKDGIKSAGDLEKEVRDISDALGFLGSVIGTVVTAEIANLTTQFKENQTTWKAGKILFEGFVLALKNKQIPTIANAGKAWAEHKIKLIENEQALARMKDPYFGIIGIVTQQTKAIQDKVHWIMEDSKSTDEAIKRLQEYRDTLKSITPSHMTLTEELGVEADYFSKSECVARLYQMQLLALRLEMEQWKLPKLVKSPEELMQDIGFTGFGEFFKMEWDRTMAGAEESQQNFINKSLAAVGCYTEGVKTGAEEREKAEMSTLDKIGSATMMALGQSKMGAIAQATISTYAGAAKTLEMLGMPWAIPFIALAILSGFKQVAAIQATGIPSAAEGAFIPRDTLVQAHRGELLAPQPMLRETFREVIRETGGGRQPILVRVFIGDREIKDFIVKTVNKSEDINIPLKKVH